MISVAIDGPAGAGKSTIARAAAKELGFMYVDTGALYRAIGLFAAENGIDMSAAALVPKLSEIRLELAYSNGGQRVLMNGRDVSGEIRAPEMSAAAAAVSAIPEVRAFLLGLQRDTALSQNVIMDGRDIGTVVLPGADVKIFLTATAEDRARRRFEEHIAKGQKVSYNKVLEDMKARDYKDANREISPLRQAEDAVLLDTTGFELSKSIRRVVELIRSAANIRE